MVAIFAVVPFDRNRSGSLVAGEGTTVPTVGAATRKALELSFKHVGALAIRRMVDPKTGSVGKGEVVAAYGEVDTSALSDPQPPWPSLH